MHLNGEFVLRDIMGDHVIVPIQSAESQFSGLITLNDTGAFLWSELQNAPDEEALCARLLEEYEIDAPTARSDVREFLDQLRDCHILKEK